MITYPFIFIVKQVLSKILRHGSDWASYPQPKALGQVFNYGANYGDSLLNILEFT
jgi:hypothetical protein